jgi:hypothetical protein
MHHDGELPRHRDGGALEADAFAKLEAPVSQGTLSRAAGQDDAGRFIQKVSYLVIATSGDVPVVVNLTGLVSARRQAEPSTDGSRRSEVARIFDHADEGGCRNDTDVWDRHQQLAGLALTRIADQPSRSLGGAHSYAAPSLKERQDDGGQLYLIGKPGAHIGFERAAFPGGNDDAEGLY